MFFIRILSAIIFGSLFYYWAGNIIEDSYSDNVSGGLSKTEVRMAKMKSDFNSIPAPTEFSTMQFYNMTDIQRDNWEENNSNKTFSVTNKLYEIVKIKDKLDSDGGYAIYTIQLMEEIDIAFEKSYTNDNYANIGFQCDRVYAYSINEKNKIENLQVPKKLNIAATEIELGSFWHKANMCVLMD